MASANSASVIALCTPRTLLRSFPFPDATDDQKARIRDLAECLDAHRKRQLAAHPKLTITGMYNVLGKLRSGAELTAKDRVIHEDGLVSLLRQLHTSSTGRSSKPTAGRPT